MCGIIGYVGPEQCTGIIMEGLRRLEYRGYDSAGIAVLSEGVLEVRREAGKLDCLAEALRAAPLEGCIGVGHTRWATHGAPTEVNAHPHRSDGIVVVHNGIIENHRRLRAEMSAEGRTFTSETDTEIVAHLVARERQKGVSLPDAVRLGLGHVQGAYAIAVLDEAQPDTIIAAKNASPLVIGVGEGANYLASDIPAILGYTRQMIFLEEGEMAVLTRDRVELMHLDDGSGFERTPQTITWTPGMAEKGGYRHYMLKEINEQPRAVTDTLRERVHIGRNAVDLPGLELDDAALQALDRIIIIGCGTSWHAGLVGEYLIERYARVPVEVELASEFRYRRPVVGKNALVVAISQSGETADTLAAIREAHDQGGHVLAICNVVGSSIARVSDSVLMTLAGPEVSVASTKAFTTQMVALYLLAVRLGSARGTLSNDEAGELLQALIEVPGHMEEVLREPAETYLGIARRYSAATNMLYLGRGFSFPIALEGALKLKEISYVHAEGYAAGEMKHGPIALIDETMPTIAVCPNDPHFDKTVTNIAEIKSRSGPVIAVTTVGETADRLRDQVDVIITVPDVPEAVQPLVTAIPMQLIAYHIADFKGTDVDQPRNLAKSVTVE